MRQAATETGSAQTSVTIGKGLTPLGNPAPKAPLDRSPVAT